jgi:hypothetical protein
MAYEIPESFSQRGDRAQETENRRITAIADELRRLCRVYETQSGTGKADVTTHDAEQRAAEQWAKANRLWIPIMDIFQLGIPGPSGHENDTYVAENGIYKVNHLLNNNGSIVSLLQKIVLHNELFPDTAYSFFGFAGFDGRTVMPVLFQPRIANAKPASQIMIDTYMAALGFEKGSDVGRFKNEEYEVWDILPRNVLVDADGDIYVVDAEIKRL